MAKPLFNARARAQFRGLVNGAVASATVTVLVASYRGRDRYGSEHDPPQPHDAMVVYKQEAIINAQGQQDVATGSVTFPFPAPVVTVDDLITLPDGTSPPIKAVSRDASPDPMRPTKIYF